MRHKWVLALAAIALVAGAVAADRQCGHVAAGCMVVAMALMLTWVVIA